jgi:ABC-type multidrug transport system ATPase subunit
VEEMFGTITEINRSGVTVLLVEQNTRHALSLCRRGFVMESGRVVLSDSGEDLLTDPNVRKAYLGLCESAHDGAKKCLPAKEDTFRLLSTATRDFEGLPSGYY